MKRRSNKIFDSTTISTSTTMAEFEPKQTDTTKLLAKHDNGDGNNDSKNDTSNHKIYQKYNTFTNESTIMNRGQEKKTSTSISFIQVSKATFYLFYWNVFCSCVSFALVVPSLWPYLNELGSNPTFLGWCVSVYSMGELFGALILGPMHNTFGTKFTLLLSVALGVAGSFLYGTAGFVPNISWIDNKIGPYFVLIGRLLQGIWTGGEQAVETAYIGENVNEKDRTKLLSTLSTFATMGFVLGPAIGTPLETFEIRYKGWVFTGNMIPVKYSVYVFLIHCVVVFAWYLFYFTSFFCFGFDVVYVYGLTNQLKGFHAFSLQ